MNKTIYCNYCQHLNITEIEQDRLKAKGVLKNHICLKYGKRVIHNANAKNHNPRLYPCAECIADADREDGKSDE